jgi:uncharacterized protein YegJ (DUF2314 family)
MKRNLIIAGLALLAIQACKQPAKKEANFSVVNLKNDDKIFLALKDTAQAHIQEFTCSLKLHAADADNYNFIVKSDFADGEKHEHMWSQINVLQGNLLAGILIDSPFYLKNIKLNDRVKVKLNEVEDWVIYDTPHNRKVGDYSAEYLKSKQ